MRPSRPSPKPLLPVLDQLQQTIVRCTRCTRLIDYCRGIGETRRKSFRDQEYWAKPVPGFGDPNARILILGLAPAPTEPTAPAAPLPATAPATSCTPSSTSSAWPANPSAISRDDGLKLRKIWIGSVVRCAPPGDKPTPRGDSQLFAPPHRRGRRAAQSSRRRLPGQDRLGRLPRASAQRRRHRTPLRLHLQSWQPNTSLPNNITLLGSYHPSLRNTNTGRLNRPMFARIFLRALELCGYCL